MRPFRALLTLTLAGPTLAVLITVTLHQAALIWEDGGLLPPKVIERGRVVETTVTVWDWLLFIALYAALIALQVALVYLVRRAWRALRTRT